jgi:hypothetical protein
VDQVIVNAIIAGLMAAMAFTLRVIWEGFRELQKTDLEQLSQLMSVKVMIADSYIKKDDFDHMTTAIFLKLDKIENKLDGKADKHPNERH